MSINKTTISLSDVAKNTGKSLQDSVITYERIEGFEIEGFDFQHSIFEGVGIKNEPFKFRTNELPDIVDCNFSHCIFRGCYFRYVKFRKCNFTNCRFIDCGFPESTFVVCDLLYAQFQNTHIEPGNVLSNLPSHENVAVSLLRSIRMNYSDRGEGDHARQCFLYEMEASAEHFWKVAFDKHSFFRDKYIGWTRVGGFLKWCQIKFEHWFWGYGESPIKLMAWVATIIVCFANAYTADSVSFPDALKISAFAFATVGYGDQLNANTHAINWILLESLIGVIFVGLLAASVFKWISRRQR